MNFFLKKFAQFKKTSYLCTRLTAKPASVAQLVRAPFFHVQILTCVHLVYTQTLVSAQKI